ncbi:MAG: guanylate kinase, partial [Oscillospiraceae bacterium]|nr:guanylate kinase [Oscillospiraceae bacterium]
DVQGAFQIREKRPDALMIFLMPPSFEDLEKRLISRGKDTMEIIRNRLVAAREECRMADRFDYIIVNDDLDRAVNEFSSIIDKEKNN